MALNPYVFFDGRCDEALEFYKKALGAEVLMLMRFKDSPDVANCPDSAANPDKVMHARFSVGGSTVFASDAQAAKIARLSSRLRLESRTTSWGYRKLQKGRFAAY